MKDFKENKVLDGEEFNFQHRKFSTPAVQIIADLTTLLLLTITYDSAKR